MELSAVFIFSDRTKNCIRYTVVTRSNRISESEKTPLRVVFSNLSSILLWCTYRPYIVIYYAYRYGNVAAILNMLFCSAGLNTDGALGKDVEVGAPVPNPRAKRAKLRRRRNFFGII